MKKKTFVVRNFRLPKGFYYTFANREVLKIEFAEINFFKLQINLRNKNGEEKEKN